MAPDPRVGEVKRVAADQVSAALEDFVLIQLAVGSQDLDAEIAPQRHLPPVGAEMDKAVANVDPERLIPVDLTDVVLELVGMSMAARFAAASYGAEAAGEEEPQEQ